MIREFPTLSCSHCYLAISYIGVSMTAVLLTQCHLGPWDLTSPQHGPVYSLLSKTIFLLVQSCLAFSTRCLPLNSYYSNVFLSLFYPLPHIPSRSQILINCFFHLDPLFAGFIHICYNKHCRSQPTKPIHPFRGRERTQSPTGQTPGWAGPCRVLS